jgi:uridine kinase
MVVVVALSGPSRSGKSRLAKLVEQAVVVGGRTCLVVGQDSYWKGTVTVTVNGTECCEMSEEAVNCTDWNRLVATVVATRPKLAEQENSGTTKKGAVLIVDGFQILHDKRLVDMCDALFHLEVPKHEIVRRRSAPTTESAPNPHPQTVAHCERILWLTHEQYVSQSVVGGQADKCDVP